MKVAQPILIPGKDVNSEHEFSMSDEDISARTNPPAGTYFDDNFLVSDAKFNVLLG